MSYACTERAARALEQLTQYCIDSTGCTNAWRLPDGSEYFYEVGKEHKDGAITGTIRLLRNGAALTSFRIEPNGTLGRFPRRLLPDLLNRHFDAEKRAAIAFEGGALFYAE